MVDSCFKLFRSKCYRKSSVMAGSRESIYEHEKWANPVHDKKSDFDISATSIGNTTRRAKDDNRVSESEQQLCLEVEPVILRRHPRSYLRSVSTTTSNDAMSSDDDGEDEIFDVLYPLPRVNTHERSLTGEESIRQNAVDKANGMRQTIFVRVLWITRWYFCQDWLKITFPFSLSLFEILFTRPDKSISIRTGASREKLSHDNSGKIHPNLLRKVLRRKLQREVNAYSWRV